MDIVLLDNDAEVSWQPPTGFQPLSCSVQLQPLLLGPGLAEPVMPTCDSSVASLPVTPPRLLRRLENLDFNSDAFGSPSSGGTTAVLPGTGSGSHDRDMSQEETQNFDTPSLEKEAEIAEKETQNSEMPILDKEAEIAMKETPNSEIPILDKEVEIAKNGTQSHEMDAKKPADKDSEKEIPKAKTRMTAAELLAATDAATVQEWEKEFPKGFRVSGGLSEESQQRLEVVRLKRKRENSEMWHAKFHKKGVEKDAGLADNGSDAKCNEAANKDGMLALSCARASVLKFGFTERWQESGTSSDKGPKKTMMMRRAARTK